MKKLIIFIVALSVSGFIFSTPSFKLIKNLVVPKDQSHDNSIVSLGGAIEINGIAKESVVMIGGSLKLDGVVEEDVICFAADVEIGKNARIKGDLIAVGGELKRHTESEVSGAYFYSKFNLKKIENTLIPILSDTRTVTFIKAMKIVLWLIIALIVFAIVPQKINGAREIFEGNIIKTGLVGLFSLFCFIFLLVTFIILSYFIIGIPFLFAIIILYLIVFLIGITVMFYFIGIRISEGLRLKKLTPALFILLGVVFYLILKFLPYMGNIFLLIMNIFELGIGVAFLLRKKLKLSKVQSNN